MYKTYSITMLSIVSLVCCAPAARGANLVTAPAALNANDTMDWGQFGGVGTAKTGPFTAISADGLSMTVTPSFGTVVLADPAVWKLPGNLPVLNNQFTGAVTIAFAQPVSGAGLFMSNAFGNTYIPSIQAFNGNTSLGTFTEQSGSAIFMGVTDTSADITSIVLNTDSSYFALDTLNLADSGAQSPGSTAPEPSSLALVASALAIQLWRRHGMRRHRAG